MSVAVLADLTSAICPHCNEEVETPAQLDIRPDQMKHERTFTCTWSKCGEPFTVKLELKATVTKGD